MGKRGNPLLLGAGVLLGLLLMTARGQGGAANAQGAAVQRSQELLSNVARLEEENSALERRVEEFHQRLMEYESAVQEGGEIAQQMARTLEVTRMEAGLVALRGPGLTVRIDNLVLPATGQVVKFVQDEDLLTVINELNAAGAEAVAVNGERLIATSEIRTAGNFININTHAQAAPFTITAIGNPQTLSAAMHLYGGVVDSLSQIARVDVQMHDEVEIPAYQGVISYEYAQAAF